MTSRKVSGVSWTASISTGFLRYLGMVTSSCGLLGRWRVGWRGWGGGRGCRRRRPARRGRARCARWPRGGVCARPGAWTTGRSPLLLGVDLGGLVPGEPGPLLVVTDRPADGAAEGFPDAAFGVEAGVE